MLLPNGGWTGSRSGVSIVQHVQVKIFAREPAAIDLADAIPVFHRWIQEQVSEELLVDVADYRHVPDGPGVMLIAHEANYSLDSARGRLGLLYGRKMPVGGGARENLRQAFEAAAAACRRLEREAEFVGKLRFDSGECEVTLNDRLLAPNRDETWAAVKPELEWLFDSVYGSGGYSLERRGEPRERFRVGVVARAAARA